MGVSTKIEWCDHTFNPWIGCTEIRDGTRPSACDNCYARTLAGRYGWAEWGAGKPRHRTSDHNWRKPIAWNRAAFAAGVRRKVFCASLADVFDAEVPDAWRAELYALITVTPQLDWLLLTKRPQVARKWFTEHPAQPNVWLGTTVENQAMADLRIPQLLAVPGITVRFLSCEPLLGPIDLRNHRVCDSCGETPFNLFKNDPQCPQPMPVHGNFQCPLHWWPTDGCDGVLKSGIDWVIAGGESGHGARPVHPDWIRSLRDQCLATKTSFFFKQWGSWFPWVDRDKDDPDWRADYTVANTAPERWRILNLAGGCGFHGERVHLMARHSKKHTGAQLDGREWREFPA